MKSDLDAARALRETLAMAVGELAHEMALRPSQRDCDGMLALWSRIDDHRNRYQRAFRALRGHKRLPDHRLDRKGRLLQRAVQAELGKMKRELNLWPAIGAMVAEHAASRRQCLLRDRPPNVSDPALTLLYGALHKLANPNAQSEAGEAHGCFADIPMRIQSFEVMMSAAYRVRLILGDPRTSAFLDVGCGGGTKVLAATRYFGRCDGLEYDTGYAEAARRSFSILGTQGVEIFDGDALTWDGYGDYDVIYYYRPLQSDTALEEMERRIFDTARPGTILVAPYNPVLEPREGVACALLAKCIFITGYSQDEADNLAREAEMTGLGLVTRPSDIRKGAGLWDPLLDVTTHPLER